MRDSRSVLDEPSPPADARMSYGPEPEHVGELRLPTGEGPHPLLVVVHGGFWRAAYDLSHVGQLCAALARGGIATWSVEYRRVGQRGGGWPGPADDVARGAEHAQGLARRFPFDSTRIALFGHSAGGHLALLAARRVDVCGIVAATAVTDVEEAWRRRLGDGAVDDLIGGSLGDVPERYAEASPIRHAPLGVRTVLVHGTDDDVVPFDLSERYAQAAGDEAELVTLPGARHFEPIDPQAREWPVVLGAIERVLRPAR